MDLDAEVDKLNHNKKIVNCAFSTDENYAQHCAVAMASLLINNPDLSFHFHLIQDGLPDRIINKIKSTVALYLNGCISIYYLDRADFAHFRVDDHITLATYYRLFLSVLLPPEIDKILYLDSDLIVRRSIRSLWDCDLEGHPIAAIFDTHSSGSAERLGLPIDYPYFNGGVLIIDLFAWRESNILSLFLKTIEDNQSRLQYHDQDVLNMVFQNNVKYLDLKWNIQSIINHHNIDGAFIGTEDFAVSIANPSIVHFTGNRKPWRYQDHVRFEHEYLHYVEKTAFSDFRQSDRTYLAQIERNARNAFPLLFRAFDALAWRIRKRLRKNRSYITNKSV